MDHPCVLSSIGAYWSSTGDMREKPAIFTERVTYSLSYALPDAYSDHTLDMQTRFLIACDVGEALVYMHDRQIVHSDLNLDNIVIQMNSGRIEKRAMTRSFLASEPV